MLKDHVESNDIRHTPLEDATKLVGTVSIPTADDYRSGKEDKEVTDKSCTGINHE